MATKTALPRTAMPETARTNTAQTNTPLTQAPAQAVVVHSGARDNYQVARALAERGRLRLLVTDLYWPADAVAQRPWARRLARALPGSLRTRLRAQLAQRFAPGLPSALARPLTLRGAATLALDKLPRAPFRWRRSLMRSTDAALGRAAGRAARRTGATLLSYSYYAYHAFRENVSGRGGAPGMLFQLHPHPASMRAILSDELARYPECAESLSREWELALPERDFQRLCEEPQLAAHTLVASSFTKQTLVEHGISPEAVTVIPYGVDCTKFSPGPPKPSSNGPLELLFVGRINQRKGIRYLLDALRLLRASAAPGEIRLTICGRVVDSLALYRGFEDQVTIRPSVSPEALVEAYRAAELFVFPSVGEGFGQVLLESLACGLPVLSTTRTAAPDLIREGVEGWVVEPGRAELLAERILWALRHREALRAMREPARRCAEQHTWARFRAGVADAFDAFVARQAGRDFGPSQPMNYQRAAGRPDEVLHV